MRSDINHPGRTPSGAEIAVAQRLGLEYLECGSPEIEALFDYAMREGEEGGSRSTEGNATVANEQNQRTVYVVEVAAYVHSGGDEAREHSRHTDPAEAERVAAKLREPGTIHRFVNVTPRTYAVPAVPPRVYEAVKLLGEFTRGTFNLWAISGQSNAKLRQRIMAALSGRAKVPQSEAGVNALQAAFYAVARPEGSCEARREPAFREWAYAVLLAPAA